MFLKMAGGSETNNLSLRNIKAGKDGMDKKTCLATFKQVISQSDCSLSYFSNQIRYSGHRYWDRIPNLNMGTFKSNEQLPLCKRHLPPCSFHRPDSALCVISLLLIKSLLLQISISICNYCPIIASKQQHLLLLITIPSHCLKAILCVLKEILDYVIVIFLWCFQQKLGKWSQK